MTDTQTLERVWETLSQEASLSFVDTQESRLQGRLLQGLRSLGGWWTNTQGGPTVHRGTPDVVGVFHGRFCGIEVKARRGDLRPLQRWVLKEISKSGGVAIVCKGPEGVQALLAALRKEEPWTFLGVAQGAVVTLG